MRISALVATAAAFATLGPPVGLLVATVWSVVLGIYHGGGVGNMLLGLIAFPVLFLPLAYVTGFVPATISGIVIALTAHLRPSLFLDYVWKRAALSGCVGVLVSAIWEPIYRHKYVATETLGMVAANVLLLAMTGGISSAALGCIFPTRKWIEAPSNNRWSGP